MNQSPLILVVDDEADFREIFSVNLTKNNFRVETAENGQEAVEKIKALKPDLVLMDVKMPVMTGTEAFLKIKEDPEIADTKVIFLTNFGEANEQMQGVDRAFSLDIGAADYIRKVDDFSKILEVVRAHL